MNKFQQSLLLISLIFSGIFSGYSGFAESKKDTLKVLFVGNSYTYVQNLPQLVSIMSTVRQPNWLSGNRRLAVHF